MTQGGAQVCLTLLPTSLRPLPWSQRRAWLTAPVLGRLPTRWPRPGRGLSPSTQMGLREKGTAPSPGASGHLRFLCFCTHLHCPPLSQLQGKVLGEGGSAGKLGVRGGGGGGGKRGLRGSRGARVKLLGLLTGWGPETCRGCLRATQREGYPIPTPSQPWAAVMSPLTTLG